ncbi:TetR/AcrR family transcriptional regulator [Puniceicoccaceae bacterium K14]|nr:TetR/AcrR family transcriptional regulator [Puniceicoccaceae bacterium K14]
MPKTSKTSYHHGDLRQALLTAGYRVLKEDGLDALSLRRVAREASVSPAAPYRHFKDKQALLAAISEQGFRQLRSMLDESNEASPGDLNASGLAYVQFAIKNPEVYRLMFTHNVMCDENLDESLKDAGSNAFLALANTIDSGIAKKEIAKTDSHALALSSWALVHGVAMLIIDGVLAGGPFSELSHEQILKTALSYFKAGWQPIK